MTETHFGEPTPETCLRVAREAAALATAADDMALSAACRSTPRTEAHGEEAMHAVHREAVEAEGEDTAAAAASSEVQAGPSLPPGSAGSVPAAAPEPKVPPARGGQPLLRRLFAPRSAREQRPGSRDVRTVIRRPQRILSPEERERVRDMPLLNLQGALIMGITDPVPNPSPMPEEAGEWVREHAWPVHWQEMEDRYPFGFHRWSTCERGTCWNCLSGRHDICVHRQKGGPDVDDNRDWVTNHQGRTVAEFIPRPDGEPCVWWCRCECPKDGPAPARPAAKRKPARAGSPAAPEPAPARAGATARAPEADAVQAALW
ncbi:DUF6248 family natural product biosynthesis protein [Streptomyces koyangensis]|uniref:DUF6248 family natural product biosynthesis protein n=1 Tax=Streptomyces koyangensis TaxID=188770 RepID=UPI003C2D4B0E